VLLVPQCAVVNHNRGFVEDLEISEADRVVQFATVTFDASVEEIFPTLESGACLILRTEEVLEQHRFLDFVETEGITVLDLPTAYWQTLLECLRESGRRLHPAYAGRSLAETRHVIAMPDVGPT